jgi:hypothetical protein
MKKRRARTKRLIIVASAVVLVTIVALFLCHGNRAAANAGVVKRVFPDPFPATFKVTGTLSLSHRVYLPFANKNFPIPIQIPEGKYLLVEYWTHRVLGANCPGLCIDFPTYYFDPQSGELALYTIGTPDPALMLGDDDVGYAGSGVSHGGTGCGASSDLTRVAYCPFAQGSTTLRYVDESGTVTLERKGQVIVLGAGETWVSEEEIEEWWEGSIPPCVVTSTHRITNYAFQDRDKIVFQPYSR